MKKIKHDHHLKKDAKLNIHNLSASNIITVHDKQYSLDNLEEYSVLSPDFIATVDGNEVGFDSHGCIWTGNYNDTNIFLTKNKDGKTTYMRIDHGTFSTMLVGVNLGEKIDQETLVSYTSDDTDQELLNDKFSFEKETISVEAEDSIAPNFDLSPKLPTFPVDDKDQRILFTSEKISAEDGEVSEVSSSVCASYKIIDVAIVYDSSFCAKYGGSAGANRKVHEIVSLANVFYNQPGLCAFLSIPSIEGHCRHSTDPYRSMVKKDSLLHDFASYWNRNRGGRRRDAAHFFSGTDYSPDNGVGRAYLGQHACSTRFGYGVNWITFTSVLHHQAVLFAHELGHNLNAHHDRQNSGFIMAPSVGNVDAKNGFSLASIRAMRGTLDTSSCVASSLGPYYIRNAHNGRRLFAQRGKSWSDGVGAQGGHRYTDMKWTLIPTSYQGRTSYYIANLSSSRRFYAQVNYKWWSDGFGSSSGHYYADQLWNHYRNGSNYIIQNRVSGRRMYAQGGKSWTEGVGAGPGSALYGDNNWVFERA